MTQEEAEKKSLEIGVKLVGKYTNNRTKTEFVCPLCNKIFTTRPQSIFCKRTQSCGCLLVGKTPLTQEEAEKKALDAGFKLMGIYESSKLKIEFECPICNKIFLSSHKSIVSGRTKSCGCLRLLTQEQAEERSLKAGIRLVGKYINHQSKTEFECPICKKEFLCRPNSILTGNVKSCGCFNFQRLTQEQAEQKSLKVGMKLLGIYINNITSIEYECLFCKSPFLARPNDIFSKHKSSCGCKYYKGLNELSGAYIYCIKRCAKRRDIEFSITKEYMWNLLVDQEFKCKLTGFDIYCSRNRNKKCSNYKEQTASLDRIDSSQGYIERNVQWVHKYINFIKNDMSCNEFVEWCKTKYKSKNLYHDEQFIEYCKAVVDYQEKKLEICRF